jgi:PAS domain S-box-containing protein
MPAIHGNKRRFRESFLSLHLLWLLIIVASVFLNHHYSQQELKSIAIAKARGIVARDLAFRRWATSHGGVYVPVTDRTPPNPYLTHVPERDITTPSGKPLTLMNPAYIVRQLNEDFTSPADGLVHITSLLPLRPENAPENWERQALTSFESGGRESIEFTSLAGAPWLRYMQALVTESPCLKCHAQQGYRPGDIRGGISLALPLAGQMNVHDENMRILYLWHFLVYLFGAVLIVWGQMVVSRRGRERDAAIAALEESEEKFRNLADFAYAWEYWLDPEGRFTYVSPSVTRITGYRPESFLADPGFLKTIVDEQDPDLLFGHLREGQRQDLHEIDFRIRTAAGEQRWLHHICRPVFAPDGTFLGRRASNYDISKEKMAEAQKAELIEELQRALDKVKLLSGFLPICASCKKIRDDRGYWNQIESYITEHSNAVFSHGICPDCKKRLYPEFCDEEDR